MSALAELSQALASGAVRVVDLTTRWTRISRSSCCRRNSANAPPSGWRRSAPTIIAAPPGKMEQFQHG